MKPLISIIIPTFNRSHLLGETLDAVIEQTHKEWECIVVDDGSTDNTLELVEGYVDKDERFRYLKRPSDRPAGGNAARNYGFEQSKGEFIQWFDSDDLMCEHLLAEQLANIVQTKKEFSICNHHRYNEDFTVVYKKGVGYKAQLGPYLDYITNTLAANLPTILFSRAVVTPYKLSETLHKSQEFEFLQRFLKNNEHKAAFLNKPLVKVRRHADSITEHNTNKRLKSALKVVLITFKSLPPLAPREVKKYLTLKYLKTLYLAFSQKRGSLLLPYACKLHYFSIKKSFFATPFVVGMYVFTILGIVNTRHYKKIYTLYR